jgi:hypothetical protein
VTREKFVVEDRRILHSITALNKRVIITIMHTNIEDRPERQLDWLSNPSAPLTEEALECFTQEASRLLTETLSQLEAGRIGAP